ncbi:bromodomain-containing protein [Mucilaginibacter ginsenosidivorax]|uniref:Uncharacterized protein n=1 Tax=Mucilaginibacter ginsenosidivorax TaxID=862126 RepID=A0A5B8VVB9_9SPHI|nr:hypothetical protein [Mucilaginibacter ginsenosidivorax]QEC74716.1 hypothetical protein FSB76_01660 [Mucilaginibacter ginsenosidivorax]
MEQRIFTLEQAEIANFQFDLQVRNFLLGWIRENDDCMSLRFDQSIAEYLANNALRDFFLNTRQPVVRLLKNRAVAGHLGRTAEHVYFDPVTGDPLFASSEQRFYNLARRLNSEQIHIPFRSVHPGKQTETGDTADINSYPTGSEQIRYNSGNHFSSRPANGNVLEENGRRCMAKSKDNLHILFKRGFLEERLNDIKTLAADLHQNGKRNLQFFVICSRHSPREGHFGASLVIMDPAIPEFPKRVMVCDTLMKELPHRPGWWNHFIQEYTNVFGDAIAELIEDVSHPLQKINNRGDEPFRHDWDCPYYVASMAEALAELVTNCPGLLLNGSAWEIHGAMKKIMPDYYLATQEIKDRITIQQINRLKRWNSGREVIRHWVTEIF